MSRRRFGVNLLSTPEYYLFSEEEAKSVYYNLCAFIKYKYSKTDYDYSILIGLSNVDGKSVLNKIKSSGIGRHKNIFVPKNKEVKYVNWHFHIMVCGAPLGTITNVIADYMQKILNIKLVNEEFDKRVYDTYNFNKYYYCRKTYQSELEMLLSGLLRKKESKKERVPKCCLTNLNVNRRKTKNTKADYFNILNYIDKQSILTSSFESKGFKIAYFDYAKELDLLAKSIKRKVYNSNRNKVKKQIV